MLTWPSATQRRAICVFITPAHHSDRQTPCQWSAGPRILNSYNATPPPQPAPSGLGNPEGRTRPDDPPEPPSGHANKSRSAGGVMSLHDFDTAVPETLINFKVVRLKSKHGCPAALLMQLASPEYGVRTVHVTCGTDWMHALASEFVKAAQTPEAINNLNPNTAV